MISKKNLLLVLLASMALTLGACQPKKDKDSESKESESSLPSESSEIESASEESESESETESESESESEEQVVVSSIEVKEGTVKTEYYVGDEFTVDGGVLVVRYSDYTRKEVAMTLSMVENAPDMSVAQANYEVSVAYEGVKTSYIINIAQGDVRQEVTIGVSYDYKGGEAKDAVDNLSFYVGKSYHFYYGTDPSEARDAVSYKYLQYNGDEAESLGTDKPYDVGNYAFVAYIPEGDESFKPVEVIYHYAIVPTETQDFALESDRAPALGLDAGNLTTEIDGFTFNYKNAKQAQNAVATLVKQADENEKAPLDDNYIEIATPVLITNALNVEFNGEEDYVHVYGSYDLEHWYLVDTLSSAKSSTARGNDYFYFRLVATPLGNNEVTITKISFTYEVDGALENVAAMAEHSDRFNHVSSGENNAYYHRRTEEVFDKNYSTKSIGIRLGECSVRVDFGTTLRAAEVKYYKVAFKFIPLEGVVYEGRSNNGVYMKPVTGETTVGKHLKHSEYAEHQTEWVSVEKDLIDFFADGGLTDIDGLNVWLSAKCTEGCVVFDDFRLIQKTNYPVEKALESISASGMTLEFERGGTFAFNGVVTANYTDGSSKTIANDDENLTISAPDLSSSGNKKVTISYTEGGVTKTFEYTISVTGEDPEAEEVLPIVAEEDDLAKKANQYSSGREYDCGKTRDNTTDTYGNSTNSLDVYNLKVDADCYINLKLPAKITKDSIHVKFFAKNLPDTHIYVQLMDVANLSDKDPALDVGGEL